MRLNGCVEHLEKKMFIKLYMFIEEKLKNLKCVKHFLGLLIAAILGIIAITTMGAVARMALHKSVQTVHLV